MCVCVCFSSSLSLIWWWKWNESPAEGSLRDCNVIAAANDKGDWSVAQQVIAILRALPVALWKKGTGKWAVMSRHFCYIQVAGGPYSVASSCVSNLVSWWDGHSMLRLFRCIILILQYQTPMFHQVLPGFCKSVALGRCYFHSMFYNKRVPTFTECVCYVEGCSWHHWSQLVHEIAITPLQSNGHFEDPLTHCKVCWIYWQWTTFFLCEYKPQSKSALWSIAYCILHPKLRIYKWPLIRKINCHLPHSLAQSLSRAPVYH